MEDICPVGAPGNVPWGGKESQSKTRMCKDAGFSFLVLNFLF